MRSLLAICVGDGSRECARRVVQGLRGASGGDSDRAAALGYAAGDDGPVGGGGHPCGFRATVARGPPFLTHTNPRVDEDGFGDVAFRMKFRVYGSSEDHRNAIVTALLGASVPTGKSGNGSCCAILSPTLEADKGFGKVDFVTSLGGTLPVSNVAKLGRQIVWNSVAQYHVTKLLWTEAEINSTFYLGGSNDGKQQTFATPGVLISRIPLNGSGGVVRLTLTLGAGEQIALTHFNTYNHSPIYSARFRF